MFLTATATFLVAPLFALRQVGGGPPQSFPAEVYRDSHGIPHIRSSSETAAWYALGYENARDGLHLVQANLKAFTGELAKFTGPEPENSPLAIGGSGIVENDALVKILGLSLKDRSDTDTTAELKALLRRDSATRPDQVYDDLRNYAKGLNDYRLHLLNASNLSDAEQAYRDWLPELFPPSEGQTESWVLTEAIDVWDVASYGPWFRGVKQYQVVTFKTPEEVYEVQGFDVAALPPLFEPQPGVSDDVAMMQAMSFPDPGSNALAWSKVVSSESGASVPVTGIMADPHGPAPAYLQGLGPNEDPLRSVTSPAGHAFWAHVQVTGSNPINTYGYMHHGAGMFFLQHNEKIAFAGSTAQPNMADSFLLRLEEDPQSAGTPVVPYSYYDYNDDTGGSNDTYRELVESVVHVEVLVADPENPGGPDILVTRDVHYWRAGEFGFVVRHDDEDDDLPVIYSPAWDEGQPITSWKIGQSLSANNTFHCTSEAGDAPMVVSYRLPIDSSVDPRPLHLRFAVGLYELLHAETVYDLRDLLVSGEGTFAKNLAAADRDGRLFATVGAFIPARGDDTLIGDLDNIHGDKVRSIDKIDIYDIGDREPVPARWAQDRMFDWLHDPVSQELVHLLPLKEHAGVPGSPYLCYVLFDPADPVETYPSDNPGYLTASNNYPWLYLQREAHLTEDPNSADDFNQFVSDSQVLTDMLESGQSCQVANGGSVMSLLKNLYMLNRFEAAAGGSEVLDEGVAVTDFAWTNELFIDPSYEGYDDGASQPTLIPGAADLPVIVRILAEIEDRKFEVLDEANRELRFFKDLWDRLHSNPWTVNGVQLDEVWVRGNEPLFWYPEGIYEEIPMPVDSPLIDFLWSQIRIGARRVNDDDATVPLTMEEMGDPLHPDDSPGLFSETIEQLKNWGAGSPGAADYRWSIDSEEASLMKDFEASFSTRSRGEDEDLLQLGYLWTPLLKNGSGEPGVLVAPGRYPETGAASFILWPLTPAGTLNFEVDLYNELVGVGLYLTSFNDTYQRADKLAFPVVANLNTSVMTLFSTGGGVFDADAQQRLDQGGGGAPLTDLILRFEEPPYEALYDSGGAVKNTLSHADVTAIVDFFLRLGGFLKNAGPNKQEPVDTFFHHTGNPEGYFEWAANPVGKFSRTAPWPSLYPLTRNLVRVLLIERLLASRAHLNGLTGGHLWGDRVKLTVTDPAGVTHVGPIDCDGENLRSVNFSPEPPLGFDDSYKAFPGSGSPLLCFFPEGGGLPKSYFNVYPGPRSSGFTYGSPYYANLAGTFASSQLQPTFFDDSEYMDPANKGQDEGFPDTFPYTIP